MNTFIVPSGATADEQLVAQFAEIAGCSGKPGDIDLLGRKVKVRRKAAGVIWFDFEALCGGPRSQNDYLELAREHHTILLADIPVMTRNQSNEARRFTWLVDVLYDARVKFIASAAAEANQLYREGANVPVKVPTYRFAPDGNAYARILWLSFASAGIEMSLGGMCMIVADAFIPMPMFFFLERPHADFRPR